MLTKEKRPAWQNCEFDKPLLTATHFGFMPIAAPKVMPEDLEAVSHCAAHAHFDAAERAALIRAYMNENMANLPHPLAVAYRRSPKKKPGYSLHFIGSPSGIAEAALIRAALSILSEEGFQGLKVDLNCVGDKESMGAYERELHNYVKKFGGGVSALLKESLKEDVFNLFRNDHEEMMQLRNSAPTSLAFLTSPSRAHFKEVLEFVEAMGIDFSLTPELIGEKNHSSHTIFAIRNVGIDRELTPEAPEILAVGYRYSRLCKKLGMRKEIPMAGVSIFLSEKPGVERKIYKDVPKPKFYLVQLGRDAKIRSLGLLELLRANRIPVHHFIGKDKLTAQLASAEGLRVPYLIIIGQKEALDGTATIRNMNTRAQDTIAMELLPQYLKTISL
jgi:histidyl-tRNA synthetase